MRRTWYFIFTSNRFPFKQVTKCDLAMPNFSGDKKWAWKGKIAETFQKNLRRIASPFLKLLSPLPRPSSYAANLKVISLSMRRPETKLRSSVCLKWREISVAVVLGNDGMQIFLSVISNKYPTILVVFLMRRSCFPAKCRQTIFGWTQHLRVEVLYPKPSGNANVFYWSNFLFSGL